MVTFVGLLASAGKYCLHSWYYGIPSDMKALPVAANASDRYPK